MKVIFAKYELDRRLECRIETRIVEADGQRIRMVRALNEAARPHIALMAAHHARLSEALVTDGQIALPRLLRVEKDCLSWEDVQGPTLADSIAPVLLDRDECGLAARLADYHKLLIESFKTVSTFSRPAPENDFFCGLDVSALDCGPVFSAITCADAVPDKLVFHKGRYWLVAPEWLIGHGYPVALVLARGIQRVLSPNQSDMRPYDLERVMAALLCLGITRSVADACLRMNAYIDAWIRTGSESAPNQPVVLLQEMVSGK